MMIKYFGIFTHCHGRASLDWIGCWMVGCVESEKRRFLPRMYEILSLLCVSMSMSMLLRLSTRQGMRCEMRVKKELRSIDKLLGITISADVTETSNI